MSLPRIAYLNTSEQGPRLQLNMNQSFYAGMSTRKNSLFKALGKKITVNISKFSNKNHIWSETKCLTEQSITSPLHSYSMVIPSNPRQPGCLPLVLLKLDVDLIGWFSTHRGHFVASMVKNIAILLFQLFQLSCLFKNKLKSPKEREAPSRVT